MGPVGPVGLVGWGDGSVRGNTGPTGVGQVGGPNFNLTAISSGTSITVTAASLGTTYYITAPTITGITLPASMSGITAGAFWMFNNTCTSGLYITLTNGTATYNGNSSASVIIIPGRSSRTLVYDGTANYIVF